MVEFVFLMSIYCDLLQIKQLRNFKFRVFFHGETQNICKFVDNIVKANSNYWNIILIWADHKLHYPNLFCQQQQQKERTLYSLNLEAAWWKIRIASQNGSGKGPSLDLQNDLCSAVA